MKRIIEAYKQCMLAYKGFLFFLTKVGVLDDLTVEGLVRTHVIKGIKKKYRKEIETFIPSGMERLVSNIIWVCWLQGIDNAPDIVKKCVESIKANLIDKKIVFITKDNYINYVKFPSYIVEKLEKGLISSAHFSDLLRLELLINYGGIWLDATTYCTGRVPDYIDNADLFVYKMDFWNNGTLIMGSWLMEAKSNSPILELTRDLLYKYWKKEKWIKNYFLMHLCFSIAAERFKEEWEKVPFFTQIDNHILSFELFNKYEEKRMCDICTLTPFHKLTYKLSIPKKIQDTFYSHIMSGHLAETK